MAYKKSIDRTKTNFSVNNFIIIILTYVVRLEEVGVADDPCTILFVFVFMKLVTMPNEFICSSRSHF